MELAPDISPEDIEMFLQEADELLQALDEDIVELERTADPTELLQRIFRAAHTFKGSAGMLGFREMTDLAHSMEQLLDLLRKDELEVSTQVIDALLHSLDALRELRDELADPQDRALDVSSVVGELERAAGEGNSPAAPGQEDGPLEGVNLDVTGAARLEVLVGEGYKTWLVRVAVATPEWSAIRLFQALQSLRDAGEVVACSPPVAVIEAGSPRESFEAIVASHAEADALRAPLATIEDIGTIEIETYEAAPLASTDVVDAEAGSGAGRKAAAGGTQTVRIDVDRLDELMNRIGELVIDRTRVLQISKVLEGRYKGDDMVDGLSQTAAHIVKLVDELQESTRKVRMQPIGTVFSGLPRLVRDLGQKMNKKLDFHMEGQETEIDRTVIERIKDPLIHLLRNSVDHGLESPDERRAAGKRETGTIKLSASQEQGYIFITVEDDGKGINPERVKAAAVSKGLISQEIASRLSDSEAVDLVFMAGASTAEKTTDISGRGVGMDIVRANIEAINGFVTADTRLGEGTRFTLKLPLTLATLHALLVRLHRTTYAVPLVYVLETIMRERSEIRTVAGREVVRLRNEVVPLLRLSQEFGLPSAAQEDGEIHVVIVRLGERLLGLVVDSFFESQEIVVKPLSSLLGDVRGIAGASVLGDGQVVLIADIPSLVNGALLAGAAPVSGSMPLAA